jgi:hypothetical protein
MTIDPLAFANQGKENLLSKYNQDLLMQNPESANILQNARASQKAKDAAAAQVRVQSGFKTLNLGASLNALADSEGAVSGLMRQGPGGEFAGGAIMNGLQNAGDVAGGLIRGAGMQQQAAEAAKTAGAFADAGNDKFRKALIGDAGKRADVINAQNAAAGAGLNDSAIGSAFNSANAYAAMDSSGVEGSNMERNIRYGMGRDAAQRELAADMMGRQGQDLSDSLAYSFDQLSQNKAAAQQQAWGGVISNYNQGLDSEYAAAGQKEFELQATIADEQAASQQAQEAFDRLSPEEQEKKKHALQLKAMDEMGM